MHKVWIRMIFPNRVECLWQFVFSYLGSMGVSDRGRDRMRVHALPRYPYTDPMIFSPSSFDRSLVFTAKKKQHNRGEHFGSLNFPEYFLRETIGLAIHSIGLFCSTNNSVRIIYCCNLLKTRQLLADESWRSLKGGFSRRPWIFTASPSHSTADSGEEFEFGRIFYFLLVRTVGERFCMYGRMTPPSSARLWW